MNILLPILQMLMEIHKMLEPQLFQELQEEMFLKALLTKIQEHLPLHITIFIHVVVMQIKTPVI